MAEIINGLNKIEQITLGEAVFGNGLNERLEQIDDNFQSIITSEYLKGDSGTSFGYATFSRKLVRDKNGNIIYEENNRPKYNIVEPNGIYWGKSELDINVVLQNIIATIDAKLEVQNQMEDTLEFEFTFIYEIINGKKNAKSSLPFVYYDPSIYGVSQNLEHEDYSCIVIFDDDFKKLNAFPTIYYNKDDDKFYWKINGIETKLTATGPKGERGSSGGFNIVTIGTNYTENDNVKEYTIEKFLYQDPDDNTYRFINISDVNEEDRQIAAEVLTHGSPCIVLQNTTSEPFIAIGPVNLYGHDSNGNMIYYVRIWDELTINNSIDASLLMGIFDQMGPGSPLRGLYVPDIMKRGNFTFYTGPQNDATLYLRHLDSGGDTLDESIFDIENLKSKHITTDGIFSIDGKPGLIEWDGQTFLYGEINMRPTPFTMLLRDDDNGNHPNNQIIIFDNNSLTIECRGDNSRLKLNDCAMEINGTDVYIKKGTTLNIAELPSGTGSASLGIHTSTTFTKGATFSKGTLKIQDRAKIDITGEFDDGDSTINLMLATGQAKIAESNIILNNDTIEATNVNITGSMAGNINLSGDISFNNSGNNDYSAVFNTPMKFNNGMFALGGINIYNMKVLFNSGSSNESDQVTYNGQFNPKAGDLIILQSGTISSTGSLYIGTLSKASWNKLIYNDITIQLVDRTNYTNISNVFIPNRGLTFLSIYKYDTIGRCVYCIPIFSSLGVSI